MNKGRITSGPVKIYDLEKPFFIIGCEYACKSPQCCSPTSPEGRKFASTDSSITRSLPTKLRDEFPAKLLYEDSDVGCGRGAKCARMRAKRRDPGFLEQEIATSSTATGAAHRVHAIKDAGGTSVFSLPSV